MKFILQTADKRQTTEIKQVQRQGEMCLHNFTNERSECLPKPDWSEAIAQSCFGLSLLYKYHIVFVPKYRKNKI